MAKAHTIPTAIATGVLSRVAIPHQRTGKTTRQMACAIRMNTTCRPQSSMSCAIIHTARFRAGRSSMLRFYHFLTQTVFETKIGAGSGKPGDCFQGHA